MPDSELSAITGRTGGGCELSESGSRRTAVEERVPRRTDSDAKMQRGPVKGTELHR